MGSGDESERRGTSDRICGRSSEKSRLRNLLVTGGAGFIGSIFVHYWACRYPGNAANLEPLRGNRDQLIETKIVGTHSLLTAARKAWLHKDRTLPNRFRHVSTHEVYGSLGPRHGLRRNHILRAEFSVFGQQGRVQSIWCVRAITRTGPMSPPPIVPTTTACFIFPRSSPDRDRRRPLRGDRRDSAAWYSRQCGRAEATASVDKI